MSITPDTKDWTWVLERPCAECGFLAADLPTRELPSRIGEWAQRWRTVLGRDNRRVRPEPGVWSPLEYGCHVRDVLRVFDKRVRLMLADEAPTFENWDQDETALVERYDEQDPIRVADELTLAAAVLAVTFAEVPDDAWGRTGLRSNGSHFTVESIGRYFAHDVVHHLHDVQG